MHLSLLFLNPLISITDWDQGISKPKAYLLFYYMDNDWQEGDRLFFLQEVSGTEFEIWLTTELN